MIEGYDSSIANITTTSDSIYVDSGSIFDTTAEIQFGDIPQDYYYPYKDGQHDRC